MMRTGRRVRGPRLGVASALVVCLLSASCTGAESAPGGADPTRQPGRSLAGVAQADETVKVVAAGDIARTPADGAGTARLVRSLSPAAVLALGDTAYDRGSAEEYRENYDPTWGAFKKITRPIPGNHEYKTPHAAGYFQYFRRQVGDREYYAWNAGPWRIYALNCEIDCGRGSPQLRWLTRDLARHAARPALAAVHSPLFTCSTRHPPARRLDDLWEALQAGNGQLVLSGDNHAYERFRRQTAEGQPSSGGLRQFVVGTGGAALYPLRPRCTGREAESDMTEGVLELTLEKSSFSWRFVSVQGDVLDSGRDDVV